MKFLVSVLIVFSSLLPVYSSSLSTPKIAFFEFNIGKMILANDMQLTAKELQGEEKYFEITVPQAELENNLTGQGIEVIYNIAENHPNVPVTLLHKDMDLVPGYHVTLPRLNVGVLVSPGESKVLKVIVVLNAEGQLEFVRYSIR